MSSAVRPMPLSLVPSTAPGRRYDLVIFDFDGTLADSGDWFLGLADHLADRFNFRHVGPDEVETLRGQSSRAVIKYLGIPRWKIPAMARYLHALLAQQTDKIALFDGVVTMIEALHTAGIRLALVTPIERAICIGDETRDIISAHKVCVTPGAVLWGYANRDALAACEPAYFFSAPDEVLQLVLGEAHLAA
jgi:phosphoglycolate phosphatase